MVKRIVLVLLIASLFMCSLNIHLADAAGYGSASGDSDMEPGEWKSIPVLADLDDPFTCTFTSNRTAVEYFVVHENNYVENSTISENFLLIHDISLSASFTLIFPEDGGWRLVFINNGAYSIRLDWEWESGNPPGYFNPISVGLVSIIFAGIIIGAVILRALEKRKSSVWTFIENYEMLWRLP